MAQSCVSSSIRFDSAALAPTSKNPSTTPSWSCRAISLPFQPIRSGGEVAGKLRKSNQRSSVVKALHAQERRSHQGIWSVRDDVQIPSSPYFPSYAQGGQGPPPMVQELFMSVISQLFQYRIIRCGGAVDDDMANIIVAQLLYLDAVDPTKDIVMYVNSPGGSVTAGNASCIDCDLYSGNTDSESLAEGRWYRKGRVKFDYSWRCLSKLREGDAELEAEIMIFMLKSEKPTMFPTEEELRKGGRPDLVETIKKKGGWYSFGWDEENVGDNNDETMDNDILEYQRRIDGYKHSDILIKSGTDTVSLHTKDDGFSSEETSSSGNTDSESLDRPLEIGADEDSGIQGILNRLEKQRNGDLGINLGENGHENRAKRKVEGDGNDLDMSSEFASTDVRENGRLALHLRHKVTVNASEGNIITNTEPESWRSWSTKRAGLRYSEFEAAEISFSKNQVPTEEENIPGAITVTSEESTVALDKHKEIDHNHLQTRLQHLESELNTTLRSLKSKREEYISEEVNGSASDLQKLYDVWEFKENEFMSTQERLRSIKAKIAVLEGKVALTMINARRTVEVKQKRIDDARRSLHLLRTTCVVWPNSASEVLLAGSFDGWTTQRKMDKSKTGMFSLCLKLYPGRYEIKFIVDGVWKIDPLRPIVNNDGYENNVLLVT